jgi:glycosyltransferase involved in cell wall biosynthesis
MSMAMCSPHPFGPSARDEALVGIAIPAYRAAPTLETTLRSCLAQGWQNWVAVVTVDGADAGEEMRIVETIGDPRIRIECNGRRVGQFGNFNRALLRCYAAGAKWIKFLCADDVLHSDALERMVTLGHSSPGCGLVYGYYDGIDEDGRRLFVTDASSIRSRVVPGLAFMKQSFSQRLFNVIGGPSSVMISRDAVERCGIFDDRLNYSGEAALWYRILSRFEVGIVGERTVLDYRFHGNSVTGRGGLSADRFSQPVDIAREIAAHHPPLSAEWWAAQRVLGNVVSANLVTALALLRKGQYATAVTGAIVSIRRVSPASLGSTAANLVRRLGRLARGIRRDPITDISPPHCVAGGGSRESIGSEGTGTRRPMASPAAGATVAE